MICNSCKSENFIFHVSLIWLFSFICGKLAFIAFCHGAESISLGDVAAILWHGLPMDLSTTAYLLLLPWLCAWIVGNWPSARRRLLPALLVFNVLAAIIIVACIVGDIALYPFWGFKLDATIWTYIDSPRDAVASVSTTFVLLHLAAFIIGAGGLFYLLQKASDPSLHSPHTGKSQCPPHEALPPAGGAGRGAVVRLLLRNLLFVLVGVLLFITLRGGITESTMNVGHAYFSDRQFLNHAAVNPVFSLLASSQKTEHFDQLYRSMSTEEADKLLQGLYGFSTDNSNCFLPLGRAGGESSGGRPSILLIFWEGCGGQLTASFGGPTGSAAITPNLDSLVRTGIFFSELRANSFRTDRGTLSTLSGHLSYPTHSLMKMAARASRLPSLARTLQAAGYTTSFTYGGDINFTNMKGYLLSTGFQHIIADTDFSLSDRATSKWGVCDSILFCRLYDEIQKNTPESFFHVALTLSSHEPWDVPDSYRRSADPDEKAAAFRYTDHHLGRFIRRLRATPLWDNLIIIILPDHGVLAADVRSWQDPRFFHIPMVWTGGAIAQPATVPVLMNQSDLPATLLAHLGLPHDDFPWSRNILSPSYTHPFTYSTYNDGFVITAPLPTGITTVFYDNKACSTTVYGDTTLTDSLTRLGKAILQTSYHLLASEP